MKQKKNAYVCDSELFDEKIRNFNNVKFKSFGSNKRNPSFIFYIQR